ncbi:MAG: hypothetical protein ACRDHN_00790 [Thermomicrobiales bacterium]
MADTDGDGFEDGDEVYLYDTDPTDPRDHPQSDEYPRNHP